MKKEILLAIVIGTALGFISMGILEAKRKGISLFRQPPAAESPTQTLMVTPTQPETPKLSITEPEDETVSTKEKITIKGKASPLATVVIIWDEGEDILVADQEGFFQTEIDLAAGPNEIEVSAYDENDRVNKQILTITYSTAKF